MRIKSKTKLLIGSALVLASTLPYTAFARSEVCRATNEKEIAKLFNRWNEDLQSGDAHRVAENYAKKSILLPTVSNKPRLTEEEKLDYFEHFQAKKPAGKIDSSNIQIDCNTAIDAGIYTFTFGDGKQVQARYTYTYKWFPKQKQWLITSHHSSAMPEKVLEVPATN